MPGADELKLIFASNLIALRTAAGLTQAELGEMIHYSDKSVSKWERAEGLPDVAVLKALSEIFGVTADHMLQSHDAWQPTPDKKKEALQARSFNTNMVICAVLFATWTLAALIFAILWIMDYIFWLIPMVAVAISLITLLVLNTIWNASRQNMLIVMGIVACIFCIIYYCLRAYTPWQLCFVLVFAEVLVAFSFQIRKKDGEAGEKHRTRKKRD